jgi:hypothetical protein
VFAVDFSVVRVDACFGGVLVMRQLAIISLALALGGCGASLSTKWTDEIAIEKSRRTCLAAGVPIEHLGDCTARELASRRANSSFLGPWFIL